MLRARLLALAAVPLVAGLAACGTEESSYGLPVYTPGTVASASATTEALASPSGPASPSAEVSPSVSSSAQASPSAAGPADSVTVTEGSIRAKGGGKAVAAAWVGYWRERFAAQHDLDAERPALLELASGNALLQVRDGVAGLRQRGRHMVGTAVVNISRIQVGTAGAKITSCLDNTTTEVDEQLRPVTPPVPRYAVSGTAVRAGDGWQITQVVVTDQGSC